MIFDLDLWSLTLTILIFDQDHFTSDLAHLWIGYPTLALTQPNLTSEKDESWPKDMEVVTYDSRSKFYEF